MEESYELEMEERKSADSDELVDGDAELHAERETHDKHAGAGLSSNRRVLWLILATVSTWVARRVLTNGFPYPICFVLLIQIAAYLGVVFTVLVIKARELLAWEPERTCLFEREYSWYEISIIGLRFSSSFFFSTAATICGAEALLHYTNLPVLCVLPVMTYVLDSLLLRLANAMQIIHFDRAPSRNGLYRLYFAFFCISLVVYEDYRLVPKGLLFAFTAMALVSVGKLIPRIGPRIERGAIHTWDCPLYVYLLTGIPPILIATVAAIELEDLRLALWMAWSWGFWETLLSLSPGAALLVIFRTSMLKPYPYSPEGGSGTIEDDSPPARSAVSSTLQASFWTACFGVFLGEKNLIDWIQVSLLTILYILGTGISHVGFYPPRLMNLISRCFRSRQQKISNEPWQLPFVLWSTAFIFALVVSSSTMYFNTNISYRRDSKNWHSAGSPSLDTEFVSPQPHLLDIVIAHSNSDSIQSIAGLVSDFAIPELQPSNPRVKVYTKDQSFNITDTANYTGTFLGPVFVSMLQNSGGVEATFLHHILNSWESLPSQTVFLTTSSVHIPRAKARFDDYFVPTLPIHSMRDFELVTSFLNLGEYATCECNSCYDSHGWQDTFHLVPSMSGAAYPGSKSCDAVLLTYGNNFVASADRIRGLGRDVWQMLYDALTNPDTAHGWAHDSNKVKGKEEGVNGRPIFGITDSLEKPYLAYTVERLWAVLLQCSTKEIAWRCPNTLRGWRMGGEHADCGCLHW